MTNTTPKEPEDEPTNGFAGADLGLNFIVSILMCTAIGYGIDVWLGTKPLFMLLFMVLGFGAGLYVIWKKM